LGGVAHGCVEAADARDAATCNEMNPSLGTPWIRLGRTYTGMAMHPTRRYVDGLKSIAHARVDQLGLGELRAEQRHKSIDQFIVTRAGCLHCPECLAHDLKSVLQPWSEDDAKLVCCLCGFTVDHPHPAGSSG
jgi:Zn ribbon nucleic-acid-binding protein